MGIKHTLDQCWRAARIWSVGSWRWGWAGTNQCIHTILGNWKRGWDWKGAAAVRSRGTPCALWFCTGQVKAAAAVKGTLCSWWGGKVPFSKTDAASSPSINITRWSLLCFVLFCLLCFVLFVVFILMALPALWSVLLQRCLHPCSICWSLFPKAWICGNLPVMWKFQLWSVPQSEHVGPVAIMHLQLKGRAVLPDEKFPLCLPWKSLCICHHVLWINSQCSWQKRSLFLEFQFFR